MGAALSERSELVVADEIAVRELVARFTDAVNRRNGSEVASLFADDGVWVVPGFGETSGHQRIAEQLEKLLERFELLVQMVHSGWVEVTGDQARARWYLSEFGKGANGTGTKFIGVYHDLLVRHAGRWRFSRRRFDLLYLGKTEASGKAYPFPTLELGDWPDIAPLT